MLPASGQVEAVDCLRYAIPEDARPGAEPVESEPLAPRPAAYASKVRTASGARWKVVSWR